MKHFQDLVEHLPVAYHSLDESGRLIDVNQDWCELLGYSREEVLGKAFIEFWAAENRQAFAERFEVFKQKGFSDNEQIVLCKKNGSQLTVLLTGRVQLNAAGAFDRTHSILVDITESRQAQVAMQIANEKLILHMAEIEYLQTELRVLLVHGLCHLLGYDHLAPDEAAAMRDEEQRLLTVLFGATAAAGLVERAGIVG
jgi:PAS domain S-box-containing protein